MSRRRVSEIHRTCEMKSWKERGEWVVYNSPHFHVSLDDEPMQMTNGQEPPRREGLWGRREREKGERYLFSFFSEKDK
jgi:hypothetical protein